MSRPLDVVLAARATLAFHAPVGGVEKYVHYLARHLRDLGVRVRIVASRPTTGERTADVDGIAYRFLDPAVDWSRPFALSASANHLRFSVALARYLRSEPPDIVHAYGMIGYAYLHHGPTARVVLQPFEEVYEIDKLRVGRHLLTRAAIWAKRRLDRYCLTHADAVAIEDDAQGEIFATRFGVSRDRLFPLPVGTDLDTLDAAVAASALRREDVGLAGDDFVLVTANRLEPSKGIDDLLDAFHLVRRREPRTRLILVGKGSLEDSIRRRLREEGLEDAVRYRGRVDETELYGLYALADLYVSPTFDSGLVTGVIEAMACGLPVVSTNSALWVRPGFNGYLVPAGNAKEMAEAILRVRSSGHDFGPHSRRTAEAYSYRTIARMALEKYRLLTVPAGSAPQWRAS
jgi:glycosyltransferase involved in cell wall biosynthesis